ncbi:MULTISPECIES: MerR family transcriptional regulator [Bacillaceae]|uniref:MerR family transcriptional regulator n=1 Tax=Evansella alkalicola TaxID=745819 RepID=A0ABS6K0A8_9BACI|nr:MULTISPECIES: MerR family transcriptional regulator [Bacillaceae]MBU9724280.1 MerR family transcriptional regulator [Bacillus alkalicola]
MISIKEVTKQTGVTVRTLRHYHQIGLLIPAGKTDGGHRLYGESELKKLQEIQFLKSLGFTLKEIDTMLVDEDHDWFSRLQGQLKYIIREKEKLDQMEKLITGLMNEFALEGKVDIHHIQQLTHFSQQNKFKRKEFLQQQFTEGKEKINELLPNINSGDPDTLEWVALLAQIKKHMAKGVDAIEVQRIIRRILEKDQELFEGNDELSNAFWEVRKSQEKSQSAGLYPIEQEVLDFLEQATEFFLKNEARNIGGKK